MQVWYLGESNRRFGWSIFQVAISLLKDCPCVLIVFMGVWKCKMCSHCSRF